MASQAQQQTTDINDLKIDVGIIKSKMVDIETQGKRIENKIDSQSFVTLAAFEKEIALLMTKEEFKPYGWVTKTIGGAFLGAIATATAYFIIKGGLGG